MQKDKENIVKNSRVKTKLMRCNDCHLDYLETWDRPEDVYKFYENNNYICEPNITKKEALKYDERKKRVERVLPYVNQNTRMLDIGCGNGAFLKDLKKHVKIIEGMELTKQHVDELTRDGIISGNFDELWRWNEAFGWNSLHWMADEIFELIKKKCVRTFKSHPLWRMNFTRILYCPSGGQSGGRCRYSFALGSRRADST